MTTVETLLSVLGSYRFNAVNEDQLQLGVASALQGAGIPFEREVRLNAADRIDFLVGEFGLECKIEGSLSSIIRQLHRYAQHDRVKSLVLLTTRCTHQRAPEELNGKPVRVLATMGAFL